MRFCKNCGSEMTEDAVFCASCGTNNGAPAVRDTAVPPDAAPPGQQGGEGAYTQVGAQQSAAGGTYYQQSAPYYQQNTQSAQNAPYYQQNPQNAQDSPYYQQSPQNPQGTPYYQQSAPNTQGSPYYQQGAQNPQGPASYQNPYGGGPNYPGRGPAKSKRTLIIIVSVIIGLCLIGGGIFAYLKLSDRGQDNDDASLSDSHNDDDDSDASDDSEPEESEDVSAQPSHAVIPVSPDVSEAPEGDGWDLFDAVTTDNIVAACEDTGMDVSKIQDLEHYGTWYEGDAYTFTYDGSVVDLLLYDDGTVFSIETGGAQIYLMSYDSYDINDYIGSTTHFDESYPASSYVFYMDRDLAQADFSYVTIETSSDMDYVVELVDQSSGNLVIAFYEQAGQSMPMPVPTGDYIIQYAAGTSWLGVGDLFGSDTVFYRSDSVYSISDENESTITLDVYGGSGIPSTQITLNDF